MPPRIFLHFLVLSDLIWNVKLSHQVDMFRKFRDIRLVDFAEYGSNF
jgi:hypothetical protein